MLNLSITQMAGKEKSRAAYKAAFYVILTLGSYMLAGTAFLTWALFKTWLCVECAKFEHKTSIWYLVAAVVIAVAGRAFYKYVKRTEMWKDAKQALAKMGKITDPADINRKAIDDEIASILAQVDAKGVVSADDEPKKAKKKQDPNETLSDYAAKAIHDLEHQNSMLKGLIHQMRNKSE